MRRGLILTPWDVTGLVYDDGIAPQLVLQLYFDDIAELEAALSEGGDLAALAYPGTLPSLRGGEVTEQAMLARPFPVPDPARGAAAGGPRCTYLVHYPGPAEDLNLWLRHYMDSHTRIMRSFPGIREIEVCSRIDWCSAMPWSRIAHMQRNKVVFDDADALRAALASPVMQEMRKDLACLPPFKGGNVHYPMRTISVTPGDRSAAATGPVPAA